MLGAIVRTARFITSHPLTRDRKLAAFARFARWQVESRLRGEVVVRWIHGTRLVLRPGMQGGTGNIYCGLHEFSEMAFVLHLLRADDLFADIGANIGSYTVLAAGVCGARVIAVEPGRAARAALVKNIALNGLDRRVRVHALALGASTEELAFSTGQDSTNHVLTEDTSAHQRVQQTTADLLFVDETPLAMKLDVGGYQAAVLAGAGAILDDPRLKALVVELNGSGSRYGFDDRQTHRNLLQRGFTAHEYDPRSRSLRTRDGIVGQNTIYVRPVGWVQRRLETAPRIEVLDQVL